MSNEIQASRLRPEEASFAFEALLAVKASELPKSFNTRHVRTYLSRPQNVLIVGSFEGTPAGFLLAYELDRADQDRPMVCLYEIGVAESFRRRGVASTMIKLLMDHCRQLDALKLWTIADGANEPAVALYAR